MVEEKSNKKILKSTEGPLITDRSDSNIIKYKIINILKMQN